MDLLQLRSFCAVVETKNFTRAGKVVHRTQSTVSTQIAQLEELYGRELLERRRGETVPTESGHVLYEYARRILALEEESHEAINRLGKQVTGELVLGASTIPGTYILPGLARTFQEQHPEVTIKIRIADTAGIVGQVMDRSIEAGIVGSRIRDRQLEFLHVADDRIVLVVPPGHAWAGKTVTPAMLSEEPFVSRGEGSGTRKAFEAAGLTGLRTVIEAGSSEAVKECVRQGLGVSLLSEWAVRDEQLPTARLKGVDIKRSFYLVARKSAARRRPAEAFIDFVRKRG